MKLVWCPPGSFTMGSPASEKGRGDNEVQHRVTLTKGFWLGKYEVTQHQWESVMGDNPSSGPKSPDRPVEQVSWEDCQKFIQTIKRANPGLDVRLPTEAEWEYACRAGTEGAYSGKGVLDDMGWYDDNSQGETHVVGQKQANAWGLHDMHGNVYEWCSDFCGKYSSHTLQDPVGPTDGEYRVYRGGGWFSDAWDCRSAGRAGSYPSFRNLSLGFRLCCSAGPCDCGLIGVLTMTNAVQGVNLDASTVKCAVKKADGRPLVANLDAHTVKCAVSEFVDAEARISDFSFNNDQGHLRIGVLELWNKTNMIDSASSQKLLAISGIDAEFSPFQKGDEAIHIIKLTISKITTPSDIDATVLDGGQWGGRTNSSPFKVVIDKLVIEDATSMLKRCVRQVADHLGAKMGGGGEVGRIYESKITRRPYIFTDVTEESVAEVTERCLGLISKELEKDFQTILERTRNSLIFPTLF